MSKKIDRAMHGPSWTEVILGALLSVILGVVLGAALLILRPVVVAKEMPKEADRDPKAVYYVEGGRDATKARQAAAKRKSFAEGQTVTLIEDELNVLAGPAPAGTSPAAAPKAAEKGKTKDGKAKETAPAAGSDELLGVGKPNFRINSGTMQIGVPVTVSVFGVGQRVIVQTRGGFVKQNDMFVYEPNELYFGSCPMQRLPFVAGYVRNKFIASQPIPDDVKASWAKLANVTIDGSALKLTMP